MNLEKLTAEQQCKEFVDSSIAVWTDIRDGNSSAANSKTRRTDKIAEHWQAMAVSSEIMTPLLVHESEAVRFAAAAYLLKYAADPDAIEELRTLAKQSQTLVGPSAQAL